MSQRSADLGIMTHGEELWPLNKLMLDLRKQLLGLSFEPITPERLDECSQALQKIMQCRKRVLFK